MSIQCSLKEIQNHESGTSTGLRPATVANEALSTDLSCIINRLLYEVGSVFGLIVSFMQSVITNWIEIVETILMRDVPICHHKA